MQQSKPRRIQRELSFLFPEKIRTLKVGDADLISGIVFTTRGTWQLPTGGFRV